MRRAFLAVLPALALLLGGAARAKDPPAPGGDPSERDRMRQQLMDQFRAMRMWQLTEELKLDDKTAARVFPMLSKYDDQERQLGREMGQAHEELRRAVEAQPQDTAKLDALVGKILDLRNRRHTLESEKNAALRKALNPQQMAKMMLLMPRIHESFRQRIRDALDGAREGTDAPRAESRRRRPADDVSPF